MQRKPKIYSDEEAYAQMVKVVQILCLNYSKEFDDSHVDLLYQYAKEDVDDKKMTWDMFFKAFKLAGKNCHFFPTYSKILENLETVKDKIKYDVMPESRQIEEKTYTKQEWLDKEVLRK